MVAELDGPAGRPASQQLQSVFELIAHELQPRKERRVTRGEVLALRLAKLAGIEAAQVRIVMVGTSQDSWYASRSW